MDLVASADTTQQAIRDLLRSIRIQLSEALKTGDLDAVLRPAPPEYWQMYFRADSSKNATKASKPIDRIEIRQLAA